MRINRWLGMFVVASAVALVAACGGGSSGSSPLDGGSGSGGGGGGGGGGDTTGKPTISLQIINAQGQVVSSITPNQPVTATATVKNAKGDPVSTVVSFTGDAVMVVFNPAAGTALTDGAGVASIQVASAGVSASGAGTIKAAATVDGTSVSAEVSFSAVPGNVQLSALTLGSATLQAYGVTTVSVTVLVDGSPTTTPTTVNFTSGCVTTGKASLPVSVTTVNGVASATYQDKGCGGADTITVTTAAAKDPQQAVISSQAPLAQNIRFVSASPEIISIRGAGAELSTVVFEVVDGSQQPISGAQVKLDLTRRDGGILLDGGTGSTTKPTGSDGRVSVAVRSGTTPTSVLVTAEVANTTLATQSKKLTITTGLPTQERFSLSVETYNLEGAETDGVTSAVTIIASDRVGNPAPDGTTINFVSEGAQLNPASCQTSAGSCSVKFVSAETRPVNDSEPSGLVTSNRISILAYAQGEESFTDLNGDNIYQSGEPYTDLGDVFVDSNENGNWAAGEQYFTGDPAGTAACTTVDGTKAALYFDARSKANTCNGQWGNAYVRRQATIVLSGHVAKLRSASALAFPNNVCSQTYSLAIADAWNNPMPKGTKISIGDSQVGYVNTTGNDAKAAVTVLEDTVPNTNAAGGTTHAVRVFADKCRTAAPGNQLTGAFDLIVTTPAGFKTTMPIMLNVP